MLALHVFQDVVVLPSLSWELRVHSSVCGGSSLLKEVINCLSWSSHLEIKRLMEILWNHELEFMQLHYSLKSELFYCDSFCVVFFSWCIHNTESYPRHWNCVPVKQQSKCLEGKTCSRSKNYQGKIRLYLYENKLYSGLAGHVQELGHHLHGRKLDVVKLIRDNKLDKNWGLARVRWFTPSTFNDWRKD